MLDRSKVLKGRVHSRVLTHFIVDHCDGQLYRVAQKSKLLYCVNSLLFLATMYRPMWNR